MSQLAIGSRRIFTDISFICSEIKQMEYVMSLKRLNLEGDKDGNDDMPEGHAKRDRTTISPGQRI